MVRILNVRSDIALPSPGHSKSQLGEDGAKLAEEKPSEEEMAYIFTANQLPSQRQLFYQLCDLREEELQRIVHSNDGRETECLVRSSLVKTTQWNELHSQSACVTVVYCTWPHRKAVAGVRRTHMRD